MSNPAPRVGKTFKHKIHEISDSGNGIIRTQGGHINLGPVLPGSEGVLVGALKLPGPYARCNNSIVLPDDYIEQIAEQFPHDLPFGGHVGGELGKRDQSLDQQEEKYRLLPYNQSSEEPHTTYTVEVSRIDNSGNGIVYIEGNEASIGKVNKNMVGSELEVRLKNPKEAEPVNENDIDKTHIVEVDRISNSGNGVVYVNGFELAVESVGEELVGSEIKVAVNDAQPGGPIDATMLEEANNNPEADGRGSQKTNDDVSSGDVTSADDSEVSLSKLRRQAVNESKQSTSSQTTSKSTDQYTRSEKVKQYVKERASGVCEGCKKEAPFVSRTGDPYLHAHHVYELSEGGADTPDTVIALCPNCHYRVHHGQDGQEYNQKLIEKLGEIEPK